MVIINLRHFVQWVLNGSKTTEPLECPGCQGPPDPLVVGGIVSAPWLWGPSDPLLTFVWLWGGIATVQVYSPLIIYTTVTLGLDATMWLVESHVTRCICTTVTSGSRAQETVCVQTWHGIPPSRSDRSWTGGKVSVSLPSYPSSPGWKLFLHNKNLGMKVTPYWVRPLTSILSWLHSVLKVFVTWLDT